MSTPTGYERRYTPYGKVSHLLVYGRESLVAACGVWVTFRVDWYGSGSQDEYEIAQELPTCKRCVAAVTR